jgi:hypothetical protein
MYMKNMFKKAKEKIAGFMTAHPKAMTYGITVGIALVLGFAMSSLAAPHDAMAFHHGGWGFGRLG